MYYKQLADRIQNERARKAIDEERAKMARPKNPESPLENVVANMYEESLRLDKPKDKKPIAAKAAPKKSAPRKSGGGGGGLDGDAVTAKSLPRAPMAPEPSRWASEPVPTDPGRALAHYYDLRSQVKPEGADPELLKYMERVKAAAGNYDPFASAKPTAQEPSSPLLRSLRGLK